MKLFRLVALSFTLVLSSSAVHAAEASKTVKSEKKKGSDMKTVEISKPSSASNSTSSYSGNADAAITGSIGSVDGNFVFGPGFQMEWPVIVEGNQFAIGFQTAFLYTSNSVKTVAGINTKSKSWGIPLMISGKYLIPTGVDFLKPYFAISTGLSIDHGSVETDVTGTNVKTSSTDLHFAILFRPGVTFGDTQHWFAELPMGVMFTDFAILPTAGYRF